MSVFTAPAQVILRAALGLTVLGLAVRAAGAVKEIVFANAFGISGETDAFVLAMTYATFPPTVLGGAIGTALIAHIAGARHAPRTPSRFMPLSIAFAGAGCGIAMYALAPVLLAVLFSIEGDRLSQATAFARILSPLGALIVWSMAMDALLNSAKQFYVPALTSLGIPLATTLSILLFTAEWNISAAAWGMTFGGFIEVTILAVRIGTQRSSLIAAGTSVSAQAPWSSNVTSGFWRAVAFLTFAGAISAIAAFVDQIFLSKLETGAVTSFNYAYKVNSLVVAIFGQAFCVVIYPYLSDLAAARDTSGLKRLALKLSVLVLPATAIVSLLVYTFSYDIVKLLFARGNFTEAAVLEVAAIQRIFAFQLVFYVAGLLATRVLNASRATSSILWISCVGALSVTLFDWLFYESLGARGIALSAVLTSTITLIVALWFIRLCYRR